MSEQKRVSFDEWMRNLPNPGECDHVWHPIVILGRDAKTWRWQCAKCPIVTDTAPQGLDPNISKEYMERLVDTSLKIADEVVEDNQNLKGEFWLMRNSLWIYRPFKFNTVYHILHGHLFVILFRYQRQGLSTWQSIRDTDSYRSLIVEADAWRLAQS